MSSDKNKPIGFKELIDRIKQELQLPQDSGDPMFLVDSLEVEISFTVERNISGGVSLQVIESGLSSARSDVQKLKLVLEPLVKPEEIRANLSTELKEKAKTTSMRGQP